MKTLEGSTKSKLFKAKQQSDSPATVSDEALTKGIFINTVQTQYSFLCIWKKQLEM